MPPHRSLTASTRWPSRRRPAPALAAGRRPAPCRRPRPAITCCRPWSAHLPVEHGAVEAPGGQVVRPDCPVDQPAGSPAPHVLVLAELGEQRPRCAGEAGVVTWPERVVPPGPEQVLDGPLHRPRVPAELVGGPATHLE